MLNLPTALARHIRGRSGLTTKQFFLLQDEWCLNKRELAQLRNIAVLHMKSKNSAIKAKSWEVINELAGK